MTEQFSLKYRPQLFKDIYGHDKTIQDLLKRSKENNYPRVTLLTGITGTGKTTLQLILLKAMLCDNKSSEGEPCNTCYYCNAIDTEKPIENVNNYNGSNLGIDEMRVIEDKTNTHILAKKNIKIFAIDELQEIPSQRSMKNLLKTLEKKNDNCYFILGAMNKNKIDKAIINRSVHYHLTLEYKEIREYLVNIIRKEQIDVGEGSTLPQMVVTITDNCEGSLRTAVSMLERVLKSNIENEDDLFKELGIVSDQAVDNMVKAILKGDVAEIDFKVNEAILESIQKKLLILYRFVNGITLNEFEKSQVRSVGRFPSDTIEKTLNVLAELSSFPYIKEFHIQFQLVKALIGNKK